MKNKIGASLIALGLGLGMSAASFAHGGHGGGHHGGGHHGGGHHGGAHHHVGHHGHHGHHGGWGHTGYRHGGWGYGPGYVVAPGASKSCRWIPRHRNNYGVWVPARKVCRVY